MDMVYSDTPMETITRVIGCKVRSMEEESWFYMWVTSMRVNGEIIRSMDKEYLVMVPVPDTRVSGRMTWPTIMVKCCTITEIDMTAYSKMDKKQQVEYSNMIDCRLMCTLIHLVTRVIGSEMSEVGMVS